MPSRNWKYAAPSVDGERCSASFQDCLEDRAWCDTVTGSELGAGNRIRGEPEPAIDGGNARDRALHRGVSIFDDDVVGSHDPEQRSTLDPDTVLREPNVGRRQVARATQLVAGDVVLGDEHSPPAELLGQRDGDRPADRIEQDDITLGRQPDRSPPDVGDVKHDGSVGDVVLAAAGDRAGALHDARALRHVGAPGPHVDAEPADAPKPEPEDPAADAEEAADAAEGEAPASEDTA